MKKTIDGKVYDGNRDVVLATVTDGVYKPSDPGYWEENLLITSDESFYFHIVGGAESIHNKEVYYDKFNCFLCVEDEYLLPCTKQKASAWLDNHRENMDITLCIEDYIKFSKIGTRK